MSSSSVSIPPADIVPLYQSAGVSNLCGTASAAFFVYDYILCLGREYQYVWQSGMSKASRRLYLYIRYISLLHAVVPLATISPISDMSCIILDWTILCITTLNLLGSAILTTLRTYVLSGKKKLLGGIVLALGIVPVLVNITTAYQSPPVNLPPPNNCVQPYTKSVLIGLGLTVCARSGAILADLITIIVTWRATRASGQQGPGGNFQQKSLHHVMWKNGNIYFITLLCLNILDLILSALSITFEDNQGSYAIVFLDPMTSILNSRFLLDLYETNAKLECGGSSLSQSHLDLSLHFTGIEGDDARAPADSPFLSSFAGPVHHSFSNADMDLDAVHGEPEAGPSIDDSGPDSRFDGVTHSDT